MTTSRHRLKVSFTTEEKEQVFALADQLGLSVSELLRRLALRHRLPEASTFAAAQAIRDLLKVNADQARLGNLLKLALTEADGAFPPAVIEQLSALAAEIAAAQASLRAG